MGELIDFDDFRSKNSEHRDCCELQSFDKRKVELIRDDVEIQLEELALNEKMPLTVAMAAGRYAAMRLFQIQGRAETMAFIDQCIATAELWDDLTNQSD